MDIQAIVEDFWVSRARGVPYPPQWFDKLTLDEACRVQLGLLDKAVAAGARQVGWKVGLTAAAIREQFRVHEPVFGYLLEEGRLDSGVELDLSNWQGTGFENELCLRLGQPLRGPNVTIKHAHHRFDVDHPGKDSYRIRAAGCSEVLVTSKQRWALMHEADGEPEGTLEEQIARMSPCDLLLIEGYKYYPLPKLEVYRAANGKTLLYPQDQHIVALATDTAVPCALPQFGLEDYDAIAAFVIETLGLKR